MKIPGLRTLKRLNPLGLVRGITRRLNPVPPIKRMTTEIMTNIIKNFLISALKSVLAALVGALGLFLTQTPPSDQIGMAVWGLVAVGIRALVSAVERLLAQPKPRA